MNKFITGLALLLVAGSAWAVNTDCCLELECCLRLFSCC